MPLLFLAGLIVVCYCDRWVGGTGGIDPAQMVKDPRGVTLFPCEIYWFFMKLLLYPTLLLLAAGLIGGGIRSGATSAEAGMRYALGSVRPEYFPGAVRFLTACARITAWGGVLLGVAACGFMEINLLLNVTSCDRGWVDNDLYWTLYFWANHWSRYAPLAGLVLGRILFGALAEGARIRSGETAPPVFSRFQDLVILGLFAIPWYIFLFHTREFF